MPMEFFMLAASVALLLAVIFTHATAANLHYGVNRMAGNREDLPPPSTFVARAKRCMDNHIENLVMFAPLVLMVAHLDKFSAMTTLAAQLYCGGRLAHAGLYLAGVPVLRTVAFAISLTGTGLMGLALFDIV